MMNLVARSRRFQLSLPGAFSVIQSFDRAVDEELMQIARVAVLDSFRRCFAPIVLTCHFGVRGR